MSEVSRGRFGVGGCGAADARSPWLGQINWGIEAEESLRR